MCHAKAFSGFQIKTVHGMAKKVPARTQAIMRNALACNMVRMWTKIFPGTFHPKQVKSRSGSLKVEAQESLLKNCVVEYEMYATVQS
jgi:hypothetical protein